MEIISKDSERTWVVCGKCGGAFDARKTSSCKCKNIISQQQRDGSVMIIGDDSDEVHYDNSR